MATVLRVTTSYVFSKLPRITHQSVRGKIRDNPNKRPHEYEFLTRKEMYPTAPVVRTGKLKYYPRDPNYQDPPYQPTKLLLVQRVKPMKGQPHWDRDILTRLGLDSQDKHYTVILKNTQHICEDLWKVKHLVKITPITFPNGEPTVEDIERTLLTEDGEMIVSDAVRPDSLRVEAQESFQNDPLRLDGPTLREQSRLKWLQGWSA